MCFQDYYYARRRKMYQVLLSSPATSNCFEATGKGWFLGVADSNDVIQKIEKTLNTTHTTTQKLTNNSFRNTKKHPGKENTWLGQSG